MNKQNDVEDTRERGMSEVYSVAVEDHGYYDCPVIDIQITYDVRRN